VLRLSRLPGLHAAAARPPAHRAARGIGRADRAGRPVARLPGPPLAERRAGGLRPGTRVPRRAGPRVRPPAARARPRAGIGRLTAAPYSGSLCRRVSTPPPPTTTPPTPTTQP